MPRGGKRQGAGRKKSALTARTREVAELAIASGATPLDVILADMRHHHEIAESEAAKGEDADIAKVTSARSAARAAARDAAPYVHPRLAAVEHTGAGGGPIETRDVTARDALADRIARLAARGGSAVGHPKPE